MSGDGLLIQQIENLPYIVDIWDFVSSHKFKSGLMDEYKAQDIYDDNRSFLQPYSHTVTCSVIDRFTSVESFVELRVRIWNFGKKGILVGLPDRNLLTGRYINDKEIFYLLKVEEFSIDLSILDDI